MSTALERFLDRYDLLAQLGSGSMGTVYLAYDLELRRQVALKRIHGGTRMVRERFRREYHALAAIRHRGVPTIYDAGFTDVDMYFTMEIVGGKTLREHLQPGRPLPPARALAHAIDLGRILMAVHAAGIVHRDVKPDNLVLDGDALRLLDFGACYMTDDYFAQPHLRGITSPTGRWSTGDCEFIGTHGYTDPECFNGETTPRSDVFSVCVLLYEMLTGRRLYDHEAGNFRSICLEEFPPELAPLVPDLRRGTSLLPFERHASMAELVQRLEIVHGTVLAHQPAPPTVISPTPSPFPWLRWFATAACFTVLGAAIPHLAPPRVDTVELAPLASTPAAPACPASVPAAPACPASEPAAPACPASEPAAPACPTSEPAAPACPVSVSAAPAPAETAAPTSTVAPTPVEKTRSAARTLARGTRSRPPPALTAEAVSAIMQRAAADLRACGDLPRGWTTFTVQVRDRRASLQALGFGEPSDCARKTIAALRFPPGTGEFRGPLQL